MGLKQYYLKKIQIIDVDGQCFKGIVNDYIYPEDNENEKESIIVDTIDGRVIEFYEYDIRSIKLI